MNEYYNKRKISYDKSFENKDFNSNLNRFIYWGEVISVNDDYKGGSIKVRIPELDNLISDENLADAYPLLPKFFHVLPKEG